MKTKITLALSYLLIFCACNQSKNGRIPSESDVDAVRNFLRASLNNDFVQAQGYMLTDSTNIQLLKLASDQRAKLSKDDNRHYQDATIRIYDTRKLSDSASIITYDNSYRKSKDSLRVLRVAGQWLVDLKYTYLGQNHNPANP
jgi:hypothetical protein